jgi:ATP-dependent Clp protease adaptor protein ClpS
MRSRPAPARPRVNRMPPWKVLLHNDDFNEMGYVIETIIELTSLNPQTALLRMVEAHKAGVAMLLATHREHAELLQEQFESKGLTVTIEPDEP